jgi:glucose dehydrogenase
MSFNPATGLVYIPGQNNSQFYRNNPQFQPEPGRQSTGITGGGAAAAGARNPAPADLPRGFLLAWDPLTQRERWRIPLATARNAGTLTTRGNLVFSGTAEGRFFALNAETGETLWETNLAPGLGSPMTYLLDGRQYIVILAGSGGNNSGPARVWAFALDG